MAAPVRVIAEHPSIITASLGRVTLIVYRSPILHDDDDMYHPVREVLNSTPHQVLSSDVIKDENMFFGEGILTIYKLEVE